MTTKLIKVLTIITFGLFTVPSAQAALIPNSEITATTSMVAAVEPAPFGLFPIEEIIDGITADISPFNGFATDNLAGTIRFDFTGPYDISSFSLWNDVNVANAGILDFQLELFDGLDSLLATESFTAIPAFEPEQIFNFSSTVSGVERADLVIASSLVRIEIREVGFDGQRTSTAPDPTRVSEPGVIGLMGLGLVGLSLVMRRRRKMA